MSWLLAFAGFALLIILHEFGHFIAAKWTGMRVERFFLFFPPKLWSFRRGETEYGIGWLPLGGFVKITGMNPDEVDPPESDPEAKDVGFLERVESVDQDPGEGVSRPGEPLPPELRERAYYNMPVWKRIVVIAAGPAVNLLVAFLIFFVLALAAQKATNLEVGEIEDGSPAAAVLQPGDRVVAVDGVRPNDEDVSDRARALTDQVNTHSCAGDPVDGCEATDPATIVIDRGGKELTVQATPYYDENAPPVEEGADPGRFRLGFAYEATDTVPVGRSPGEAVTAAGDQMWFITSETGAHLLPPVQGRGAREALRGRGQLRGDEAGGQRRLAPGARHPRRDQPLAGAAQPAARSCRSTAGTSSGAWSRRSAAAASRSASWSAAARSASC